MKEVKEEEGLLEREASSLVRLTKPTSNYRHIGLFLQIKAKIEVPFPILKVFLNVKRILFLHRHGSVNVLIVFEQISYNLWMSHVF